MILVLDAISTISDRLLNNKRCIDFIEQAIKIDNTISSIIVELSQSQALLTEKGIYNYIRKVRPDVYTKTVSFLTAQEYRRRGIIQ